MTEWRVSWNVTDLRNQETLQYACVCGNGQVPDLKEYTLTIPYHTCITFVQQCVQDHMGDNLAQAACAEEHPCGAKNPTRSNTTSTTLTASKTASPSATSSGTGVFDGLAGDATDGADSSNNSDKKNAAPRMLESVGATLLLGLAAGFAVML